MSATFTPAVVMVTGGAGFIGSNLLRWLLAEVPDIRVVNLDLLTYSGNRASVADVESRYGAGGDGRYFFVHGDIRDTSLVGKVLSGSAVDTHDGRTVPPADAILHLAAETHVDRSIDGPAAFVSTNVMGTHSLLMAIRSDLQARPRAFRFVNVSSDEVYGSLGPLDTPFTESSSLSPNSPYSASKAGADCLVRAYVRTFGLPCLTTRCSNNFGPWQHPEKLIPLMVTRALRDQPLPVYGDGEHVREWLHVVDHAEAIWRVCVHGRVEDEVYNVGGGEARRNIDVVNAILRTLGKPASLIRFVPDRPGHDRRYAMDSSRIHARLAWSPSRPFEAGLRETIAWYAGHDAWWTGLEDRASPADPVAQ